MKIINSLLLCAAITTHVCANEAFKKLDDRIIHVNSLVGVGLDPDLTKMPYEIINSDQSPEQKTFSFLKEVITITAPHSCCFKLQKAFYDQFDLGHELLRQTVQFIHENYPDIPAYVDCKIGDTDNTMKAYMSLLFDDIKADAVVINPYMGDDVLEPFMNDPKKTAIVLIQTSNPNAKIVQDIPLANGKKLWQEMLDLALERWNKNNNLIFVLSSNSDCDYSLVRSKIPQNSAILLAGIGLQGGNPQVVRQLLNNDKRGVFVNSSRGILYPYAQDDANWRSAILSAVIELKNVFNDIREQQ